MDARLDMTAKELTSRFAGAIAGFAIGDALGMPAQFLSRDLIKEYYGGPITGFIKAHRGHASDFLPAGSYTDDTQMMLAAAECLIEYEKLDPARQAEALSNWYQNTSPHRTPMKANVQACKHLTNGKPWTKSGVFSAGCGAAVRMPPIGLMLYRSPEALVRAALETCSITHTEPHARGASVAVAYLVSRLVQTSEDSLPGDQVLETADRVAPIDGDVAAMLRWVTQLVPLPPEKALFEIGTSSDALEVVAASTYCFLKHPRQFAKAVLPAVNAGDATDSIAALAGCFVGACSGLEAIPKEWLAGVENSQMLVECGKSLAALVARLAP
jgi:ADP-ribosylglycohydrolase